MSYIWEDSASVTTGDDTPRVVIFGRNTQNPMEVVRVHVDDFIPYFYAPARSPNPSNVRRIEEGDAVDALGRSIKKIYTHKPGDVRDVRKLFDWTDEADVLFDVRYMVDNDITYGFDIIDGVPVPCEVDAMLPRIMYFDIEVRSPKDIMPKPEKVAWPISMIQCRDSYTHDTVIFTCGVPLVAEDQIAFSSEKIMLNAFFDYVAKMDYDVLTGWYSNGFDLPYIIGRANKLNISTKPLSRVAWNCKATNTGRDWMVRVPGRQCVDMMEAFKKWYKAEGELEKYDLKSVSAKFADFTYTDYGARMEELFSEERWDELIQYGRNDVIALDLIDNNLKLFDFYEGLRHMTGVKLEDTLKNSKMIESLLMRDSVMKPMPTRSYGNNNSESFEGALVLSPKVGLHSNTGVFDLAALYPNIILAFNISPDIDGVVPRVIKTMMEERERLRALKKAGLADESTKKKEIVVKFIVNSFYGVLGWPQFRLYRPELAEFITRTGREINIFLQECAAEIGHETIYGDTDSIFTAGVPDIKTGMEMQDYFNNRLIDWAADNNAVVNPTLKFEKLYRRILFKKSSTSDEAAKKRYAGHLIATDNGPCDKLSYTGIELKRSDQSEITRSVLNKFLEDVLLHDDIESALQTIRDSISNVSDGESSPYEISIPKGVKNREATAGSNLPWIRGMKNNERLTGEKFPEGVKPRLLYCKRYGEVCIHDESDIEWIRSLPIDWRKQKQKVIEAKMRSFVESMDINWEQTMYSQSNLFGF